MMLLPGDIVQFFCDGSSRNMPRATGTVNRHRS
jgi:hypothetical protein